MRKVVTSILGIIPLFCFGQTEVGPDGYVLYVFFAILLSVPLLFVLKKLGERMKRSWANWSLRNQIGVRLTNGSNGLINIGVENRSTQQQTLDAPTLIFRKGFSTRKFRLKGINKVVIYPLVVESGQARELQFNLNVFHKHDAGLKHYRYIRISFSTNAGKVYSTNWTKLPENNN